MKRLLSSALGKIVVILYGLGFLILSASHVYATVIAYHYLTAWKVSRAMILTFATFLIPVVSTLYWLVVHWLQTEVFWNGLTVACASGLGVLAAGMICEMLQQWTARS
ncbi:MAG: hypothetical protein SFV21_21430 [Rhodospirillaceae bacterium]|nr:hypothetical protein [Rhodospirillaceae bacterium]